MKIKFLNVVTISILALFAGCANKNEETPSQLSADCADISFLENYSLNCKNENVALIKGVALDVYRHGRNIKIIDVFNGNLSVNSSIFVWGAGTAEQGGEGMTIERWDIITQYDKNDTLIMIVEKIIKSARSRENPGDYETIQCAHSILKLSNGNVTGKIFPFWEREIFKLTGNMTEDELKLFLENLTQEELYKLINDTMSWEELLNLINDKQ